MQKGRLFFSARLSQKYDGNPSHLIETMFRHLSGHLKGRGFKDCQFDGLHYELMNGTDSLRIYFALDEDRLVVQAYGKGCDDAKLGKYNKMLECFFKPFGFVPD